MKRRSIPIAAAAQPLEPVSPQRRVLVQWLAAAAALAAGGCTRTPDDRIVSLPASPQRELRDAPQRLATAIGRDGWAQGVQVTARDGRPVKVDGLEGHWSSLGRTDAATEAALLGLWDPDRSSSVVQRDLRHVATPSTWGAFMHAWTAHAAPDAAVHVLTPRITSPTLVAQLAGLLGRRPGSAWYRHDAVEAHAATEGAVLAFGRPALALPHAGQARLIVSFGDDPFSSPGTGVRFCAEWAGQRELDVVAGRPPARLVALEVSPSLFGARADRRVALTPVDIEDVLWRVGHALDASIASPTRPAPALDRLAAGLAARMRRHRGQALLCAAPWLSAESHALVHHLHTRLDAFGHCVTLIDAPDSPAALPPAQSLTALVDCIRAGGVQTLLVVGGNPVYSAAAELALDVAIARVPMSAHLAMHDDETSQACRWHLPTGHAFEQWSDLRAPDGSVTVLQPVIAPLYDTRSVHELLALIEGRALTDEGRSLVRSRLDRDALALARRWQDTLEQGWVADSAAPALRAASSRPVPQPPNAAPLPQGSVWGHFERDAAIGDGADANNGWLQELPRPFTSITWGNAAVLGPATALAFGVRSGDTVRLHRDGAATGASVEAPVWILPDHAENVVSMTLGHGRRAAGRVGNGVGVDTAALRSPDGRPVALRIERVADRTPHVFARVQLENGQQGRDLARHIARGAAFAPEPDPPSLYDPADAPSSRAGPVWAMAIDLDACIGCNACSVACQAENNIPVVGPEEVRLGRTMHWIRVDAYRDEHRTIHQPVPCMHCENAPCELVCPVGATVHDSEGVNVQVYNRCIGTRFCSNNCPYKVRRFNFRQYADVTSETARLLRNPDVTVRSRGVMEKCNYCLQRLSHARREDLAGAAPDLPRTACQSACPTRAIRFGDLGDPASEVARARRSPRHYAMLGELGTRPRTTYLARLDPSAEEDA